MSDVVRRGGGAKVFFLGAKADGAGGGVCVAFLFAVELYSEPNMFFVDVVSTSPNF